MFYPFFHSFIAFFVERAHYARHNIKDNEAEANHSSWDALYAREIANNLSDPSDVGTIWFDDSGAEDKVVAFLKNTPLPGLNPATASFLDSGTGNGHLLFRLREETEGDSADSDEEDEEGTRDRERIFKGPMLGTDYSTKSIEFARRIAQHKEFGPDSTYPVHFTEWDILNSSPSELLTGPNTQGFDVILDKGTFDAISLSQETDEAGRRVCEGYKERIWPLMMNGGRLLITSCNWTEEELRGWFEDRDATAAFKAGREGEGERWGLAFERDIEYRSFSFGGHKGQTVASCCFKKIAY
jgi:SAM-dependent methyltransferase